jgi:predicted transglutaminase-like cysteine proteinase
MRRITLVNQVLRGNTTTVNAANTVVTSTTDASLLVLGNLGPSLEAQVAGLQSNVANLQNLQAEVQDLRIGMGDTMWNTDLQQQVLNLQIQLGDYIYDNLQSVVQENRQRIEALEAAVNALQNP